MRAKDKIMVKATVEQSLFLSIPKNYSPEVQFFGTNQPQESHEFFL